MSTNSTISVSQDSSRHSLLYLIFQAGQLISLPAYVFVITNLLCTKTLRQALANHAILLLLTVNLIEMIIDQSLLLNFLRTDRVSPSTPSLCLFWLFVDAYVYDTGILLMCWASMERHILIFHEQWLLTRRQRVLVHYFPLIIIVSYTFCFFIYAMFFFPCQNSFDYTSAYCGYACYYISPVIVAYESLAHEAIPILLIGLFNVALVIRVITGKRHLRQSVNWRKYRKMTVQLLSVSALYFGTNFIYTINPIATLIFGITPINDYTQQVLLNFVSEVMPITLPYFCLGLIPNLKQKCFWRNRRRTRIEPILARPKAPKTETRF